MLGVRLTTKVRIFPPFYTNIWVKRRGGSGGKQRLKYSLWHGRRVRCLHLRPACRPHEPPARGLWGTTLESPVTCQANSPDTCRTTGAHSPPRARFRKLLDHPEVHGCKVCPHRTQDLNSRKENTHVEPSSWNMGVQKKGPKSHGDSMLWWTGHHRRWGQV